MDSDNLKREVYRFFEKMGLKKQYNKVPSNRFQSYKFVLYHKYISIFKFFNIDIERFVKFKNEFNGVFTVYTGDMIWQVDVIQYSRYIVRISTYLTDLESNISVSCDNDIFEFKNNEIEKTIFDFLKSDRNKEIHPFLREYTISKILDND